MKTSLEGLIVAKSDKLKDRHDAQYLNMWLRQRNLDFRQTWRALSNSTVTSVAKNSVGLHSSTDS